MTSQQDPFPYGHVSLLEMIRKYVSDFMLLADVVARIQTLRPKQENSLVSLLSGMADSEVSSAIRAYWPGVRAISKVVPLPSVLAQIGRIERALKEPHSHDELMELMRDFERRLEDDLNQHWFYHVRPENVEMYVSKEPFGSNVFNKFSKARDDVESSGKCLALGQGTACVFHIMRAMECAVKELASHLKVSKVEKEWAKLLSDIKSKVEALPKGDKRTQWLEAHSLLYSVKEAWRNPTMHPKRKYSEEEAKEVYLAARTFMRFLARLV